MDGGGTIYPLVCLGQAAESMGGTEVERCARRAQWDAPSSSRRVLERKITRSKTSGQGKRIEVMFFFVAKEVFLLCPDWLKTGWDLNCELSAKASLQERDYLVPKPTMDLMGFRRAFVKYQDALTMSRAFY